MKPYLRSDSLLLPISSRWLLRIAGAFAVLALPYLMLAQSGSTGTITGRVLNPATKEYVRNAEVKVEGTNLVTATEEGGYYRLLNVPAGTVNVVATFPGAESASASTVPRRCQ